MKRYFLGPLAFLLPVAAASAQSFAVTGLLPAANSTAMPRTGSVSVRFSQPLAADAATAGGLKVFSSQYSGLLPGTTTVAANSLTFQPANGFRPGEKVLVSVPTTVRSSTGTTLARPTVYELTAAAQGAAVRLRPRLRWLWATAPST
ncbi:Ig-like domain-containing protein [Hymenobacter cellulosilyticus]|uniref:Ig-like domain-containing protein n=1 Tax=Hymenobacter cellulosilyticus TaxID=2932248 RepID=A0A8T9Q993_9BACT|nr:Ig-like domain-containing protein [Hymenobacter cellulosilyticus]UOQ73705.1 Ig-like domain-containing protein [Hymenobacter cellulosilyticus]